MMSFAKLAVVVLVIYVCFFLFKQLRIVAQGGRHIDAPKQSKGRESALEELEKCPRCGVYGSIERSHSCSNCDNETQ